MNIRLGAPMSDLVFDTDSIADFIFDIDAPAASCVDMSSSTIPSPSTLISFTSTEILLNSSFVSPICSLSAAPAPLAAFPSPSSPAVPETVAVVVAVVAAPVSLNAEILFFPSSFASIVIAFAA